MSSSRGKEPTDDGTLKVKNVELLEGYVRGKLDIITEFVDQHIRYYRLLPSIAASAGVIFVIYYFHIPVRRIRSVSLIPKTLITKNKTISGVVKAAGHDSLGVWHVPMWKWILRVGTQPPREYPSNELLKVQFSGIDIQDEVAASVWLKEHLTGQRVWLRMLSHAEDTVHGVVYHRKPGLMRRKSCANAELLKLGMASVTETQGVVSNSEYAKLMTTLLRSEQTARSKGIGVWYGTEYVTWWNRFKYFIRRNN